MRRTNRSAFAKSPWLVAFLVALVAGAALGMAAAAEADREVQLPCSKAFCGFH